MKQWFLVLLSFIFSGAFMTVNAQQGTAEWSRRAGSNGTDQANGVVTDASGNVYVTGSFSGSGADFGNGIFRNSSGAEDVFLAKYSSSGSTQWVNVAGASGTNFDRGRAVAVDNMGNVIVAGFIEGSANFANTTLTSSGLRDAFVAKYDANGGLLWAKRMGGIGRDEAYDVTTDAAGNIYVTGLFQNNVTIGTTTLTSRGDFDAFTAKLDANGNPVWANGAGGGASDQAWSISVDGNNVFITGYFDGIAQFDGANGILERTTAGGFDVFVAGIDATTGKVSWVNSGGGVGSDYGHKILAERGTGASYVTGRFFGTATFNGSNGTKADLISTNSSDDVYLVKYGANGEVVWAKSAGSTQSDFGNALAIDNGGDVYVVGQFQGSFNWTGGVDPNFQLTAKGNYDLFVARYRSSDGTPTFVKGFGTSSLDVATGISMSANSAYVTGYYTGTIKFDNNPQLSSPGLTDVFVAKLGFDVQPCNLVTPTISAGSAANCQQLLTVNGAGNVSSFNWFRNGVQINGQNSINLMAVEAGTYTVQGVSGGCVSAVSQGVNVSISNNLNVSAAANPNSITAGQSSTLSVTVTGNSGNPTITWRDNNGNVIGSGTSVSVSPTVTSSYSVEVADNNGCRRTTSVTVNVLGSGNCRTDADIVVSIIPGNDNVVATNSIAEICEGQSTGLQAIGFIGNNDFTYTWIRESPNGDIIVRSGSPSIESIVTETIQNSSNQVEVQSKTVRYRLRVSSPGCPDATSNPIDVRTYEVPSVVVSSNQTGACATGNVILTASASGGTPFTSGGPNIEGGYRYRWEPANAVIGSNITRVVTVNPAIATTFTVTAEDAITCGKRTQVVVNPSVPTIQITPAGPLQVCTGNTVTLSANLSGNPTVNQVVRWYANGVLQSNLSGSMVNVTGGGNWSADIFDRSTNCRNTSNIVSVAFGTQANANAGANRTICAGNSTVLGMNPVAGVTYSWFPTEGLSNAFIANPVARPGFTTTYTLTASTANCPASSATVTVTVEQPGIMPMITTNDPTTICPGGAVNFMITNPTEGVSYTWYVNGGARTSGTMFTLISETGTVTARANVNGGGVCSNPFSNAITVNVVDGEELMVPKIQPFGSATLAICNNQSVRMFTDRVEGLSYQWWFNGEVIPGANDTTYTATMKGIYHVQVFAGNVNASCASKKSEGLFITESNVAPVSVTSEGDRNICAESNVCLKFHATTGHPSKNIVWNWMPKTGTDMIKQTKENGVSYLELCVKPLRTTTYTVFVKDDFGCMNEVMTTVNVRTVAQPSITDMNELCVGQKVTLNGAVSDNNFYRWFRRTVNNSTDAANMNTPTWVEVTRTDMKDFKNDLEVTASVVANANGYPKEQYALESSVTGCGMMYSNIFTLTSNANPTVRVSGSGTFCENSVGTRTLTASVTAGNNGGTTSVSWSAVNGTPFTVSNNGLSITTSPSATDEFVATVSNARGCSASASGIITVVNRITPSISGGGVICNGSSTTLSLDSASVLGYTIQWQRASTQNGSFSNVGFSNYYYQATQAGFYRVSINSSTCGTFTSNIVEVSVIPVASFNVSVKRTPLCYGEPIELFMTGVVTPSLPSGQFYNFTWKDWNGNIISTDAGSSSVPNRIDINSISYPDSNSKAYSYTLEVTHPNGCVTSRSVSVSLEKLGPRAEAVADKPMVCEGTKVMLKGKNAGKLSSEMLNFQNLPGAYRYVYYRWNGPTTVGNPTGLLASGILEQNGAAVAPNPTNRDIAPLAVMPLKTTTYTLTLSTPLNECVATCEVTVEVGPKLVATVQNLTENENLCEGSVTLRAICNSSNPGIMYQWYADVSGTDHWTPIPGATSQDFMPTTGGNYNVKVWMPGMEACYDYADRYQTITGVTNDGAANDLVSVMKNGDWMIQDMPAVICAGQEIDLQARYIFGAAYQWYKVTGPKDLPTYVLIPGETKRTLRVNEPGNYRVNVIAGCFSCPGSCETWSQTCPVVVMPELKPTVLHNGHIELCEGNHVELYTQGKTSQYNYQWYYSAGYNDSYVEMAGETNPRLITKAAGRYKVKVGSIFTPVSNDPNTMCYAYSMNFVDVKSCEKDYCPMPISVRGILNVKDGSMVNIAWDQPLNSSQYNITGNYRLSYGVSGTPSSSWTTVTVMGKTWYSATGLLLNTKYDAMVVTLCDGVDKESDPEMGSFKTLPFGGGGGTDVCPDLNQPNDSRSGGATENSIIVLWDQVADNENNLIGYRVEYRAQGSQDYQFVEVLKSSLTPGEEGTVTLVNLTPNTSYEICVRPYCAAGPKERIICDFESTLPDDGNPGEGSHRTMSVWLIGISPNDARIAWLPVEGATGYLVRREGLADPILVDGTDVLLDGLSPSTTYAISVEPVLTEGALVTEDLLITTLPAGSPASRAQLTEVNAGYCTNNNLVNGFSLTWPENSANVLEYRVSVTDLITSQTTVFDPLDGTTTGIDDNTSGGFALENNKSYLISVTSVFIDGEEMTLNALIHTANCSGKVAASDNTTTYNVYPNPTKGDLNVEFSAKEAGNVSFKMLDAMGRVVYSNTVKTVQGVNNFPINANISGGIYMLQIQNGGSIYTSKIVVE